MAKADHANTSAAPKLKEELEDFDSCGCAIKAKILAASKERFSHYGYSKTTISDIAKDCEMSSGNIYRYYESKLDIAAVIVRHTMEDIVVKICDKAAKTPKAREKLRVILFENMRKTYDLMESDPRLIELMLVVRKERPEIRRWGRRMERKMIADALKHGKETKEFSVDCTSSVARVIQCLVSRFRWSKISTPHIGLKRLETELEGTFMMIYAALTAGLSLGKIMRRHPKEKEQRVQQEKQALASISTTENENPATQN